MNYKFLTRITDYKEEWKDDGEECHIQDWQAWKYEEKPIGPTKIWLQALSTIVYYSYWWGKIIMIF